MSNIAKSSTSVYTALAGALVVSALTFGVGVAGAAESKVMLTGAHEVPPVTTTAKGEGTISVNDDKSVSGSVTTSGMEATMAHIHEAAMGKNGPPIITLEKKGNDEWMVPEKAQLTDAQLAAYKAGNLYVNVHSDAHKGGEIRDQLKP